MFMNGYPELLSYGADAAKCADLGARSLAGDNGGRLPGSSRLACMQIAVKAKPYAAMTPV
jgi:hypothetical protein